MSHCQAAAFLAFCLASAVSTGCVPSGPQPPGTGTPHAGSAPPLLVDERLSGYDNAAYLLPMNPGDDPDRRAPAEVWRRLGPDLAADPETARLMGRLYGGLGVELTAAPATAGKDDPLWLAPPSAGHEAALRLCFLPSDYADRRQVAGLDVPCGVTTLNYSCVVRVPADAGEVPGAEAGDEPPGVEALGLALEDYFLRHPCGWKVVFIGSVGEDRAFMSVVDEKGRTAAERRAGLDGRIEDYAGRYRMFLAARGRR